MATKSVEEAKSACMGDDAAGAKSVVGQRSVSMSESGDCAWTAAAPASAGISCNAASAKSARAPRMHSKKQQSRAQ
eukprot:1292567-Rhodomonas_salina.2